MMLMLIALLSLPIDLVAGGLYPEQGDKRYPDDLIRPAGLINAPGKRGWLADNDVQFLYAGGNPWALPETTDNLDRPPDWQSRQYGYQQKPRDNTVRPGSDWNTTRGRFVTPEILESLKKQQTQAQQVYPQFPAQQNYNAGNYYPNRGSYYGANLYRPNMPAYNLPYGSYYSPYGSYYSPYGSYYSPYGSYYSPYGMNYYDPIYDVPSASPWLMQPDSLLSGSSFGYVPDEAIGGIAPMEMSVFDPLRSDGMSGLQNRLFNPYNFLNDMK